MAERRSSLLRDRSTAGLLVELCVSTPDAFEICQAATARGQLGMFDQHIGNIVLDRKPWPAPGAAEGVALPAQASLAERTDQDGDKVFVDHGRGLLRWGAATYRILSGRYMLQRGLPSRVALPSPHYGLASHRIEVQSLDYRTASGRGRLVLNPALLYLGCLGKEIIGES